VSDVFIKSFNLLSHVVFNNFISPFIFYIDSFEDFICTFNSFSNYFTCCGF